MSSNFTEHASRVVRSSKDFLANIKAWDVLLDDYHQALECVSSQGSNASVRKHLERGQLLARNRVALLLDEDSPFLELCSFAGYDNEESTTAASLVTGIGLVNNVPTVILGHIPSINGGAWNEFTVRKQNRITAIATENKLPIIALVQSAGVFLPLQFRVFHIGGHIFRDLARRTMEGHASCAVVFGSSTAGGAYHPALSDHSIFVKNHARVFLGAPPLVKMATGEVVDAEDLGGAEMHASVTGLADELATDEFDAIRKAREWILTTEAAQRVGKYSQPQAAPCPPKYDAEDLLGIVNPDIRAPMDMMEILLHLVDSSRLSLFKPTFGTAMITTYAHIHGHLCGIIANQRPIINPAESDKATQFIHLCNQSRIPIIFLHNVTGFMVGLQTERAGLIKKGARFVAAVSTSSVPHISIICGASYGAGNYAMCGRSFAPRFLFAWPSAKCSAMGAEQLTGVMESITRTSAKNAGREIKEKDIQPVLRKLREGVERDSGCYQLSSHLHDDGIIDPRDTREVLGMCLEVCKNGGKVGGAGGMQHLARL
jgi:acetyl-CoA carboxylase carboxyltransferase component